MQRIDITSERRSIAIDGESAGGDLQVASEKDVTFPAVWKDGERVYDVEVWRDGELLATVPPRSDDVDASFEEHERRRS